MDGRIDGECEMKLYVAEKSKLDLIKKWVSNPRSVSEQELVNQKNAALMNFVSADWSTKDSYENSKLVYEALNSICKVVRLVNMDDSSNG